MKFGAKFKESAKILVAAHRELVNEAGPEISYWRFGKPKAAFDNRQPSSGHNAACGQPPLPSARHQAASAEYLRYPLQSSCYERGTVVMGSCRSDAYGYVDDSATVLTPPGFLPADKTIEPYLINYGGALCAFGCSLGHNAILDRMSDTMSFCRQPEARSTWTQ